MSFQIRYSLVLVPLLSIMAMSPQHLQSKLVHRSPASSILNSPYPLYEGRTAKIEKASLELDSAISMNDFSHKVFDLKQKLDEERKNLKKDLTDAGEIKSQQEAIELRVKELLIVELNFKNINGRSTEDEELKKLAAKTIEELKVTLESLLVDVEPKDVAVVVPEKKEEPVVLKEEVAKVEEVKEVAKEEVEVAKAEEVKEEVKEEDTKKSALEERLCGIEDQNALLASQLTTLISDQGKIIDLMLSLQLQIQQQMQQRPAFTPYYAYPQVQQPIYSYAQEPAQPQFSLMPQQAGAAMQQQQQQPYLVQNFFQQQPQESLYQPIMGANPGSFINYDPRYTATPQLLQGSMGQMGAAYNFGG